MTAGRRPMRPIAPQGTPLPPAEPPAVEVVEMMDRLQTFRQHLDDAERQLRMIELSFGDVPALPPGSRTMYRIEARVARNRITLWTREVRALERRGRAMGLAL